MHITVERRLRDELSVCLSANSERLLDGLRAAVSDPLPIFEGRPLQFEVNPDSLAVVLRESEVEVLPGWWLSDGLPSDWLDRADDSAVVGDVLISSSVARWFAEAWDEVGGPWTYSPSYLFWRGFETRYDLEARQWLTVEEFFSGFADA